MARGQQPDANTGLPLNAFARMLELAAAQANDDCLGLHFAHAFPRGGSRSLGSYDGQGQKRVIVATEPWQQPGTQKARLTGPGCAQDHEQSRCCGLGHAPETVDGLDDWRFTADRKSVV